MHNDKIVLFLSTDVLTAGPGPAGCRQTTTMAEENVSFCTSTQAASTASPYQRLRSTEPQLAVPPARVAPTSRAVSSTATISSSSSSSTSPPLASSINKISSSISNDRHPKAMTNCSTHTAQPVLGSRSASRSRKVSWASTGLQGSRRALSSKLDSHRVAARRSTIAATNSCPLIALISRSRAAAVAAASSPVPRRAAGATTAAATTASTLTRASSSLPRPGPILSLRRLSLHLHPRRQPATGSSLHHPSRPAPATSTPLHSLWLATLLLIAFCPPVLRVPGTSTGRHQPHRCPPRSSDSPPPSDCWPGRLRPEEPPHPHRSPRARISNGTLDPRRSDCSHRPHRYWPYSRRPPIGAAATAPPALRMCPGPAALGVTPSPRPSGCSRLRRYTPRCPNASPAAAAVAVARSNPASTLRTRRSTSATTITSRRRSSRRRTTTSASAASPAHRRGTFRARRTPKERISVIRPVKGYSRRRLVRPARAMTRSAGGTRRTAPSRSHARSTRTVAPRHRRHPPTSPVDSTDTRTPAVEPPLSDTTGATDSTTWPCRGTHKAGQTIGSLLAETSDTCPATAPLTTVDNLAER